MPTRQRIVPKMNISPPIMGVPALLLCQVGPISRMDCPAFSARSTGSSRYPMPPVRMQPAAAVIKILVMTSSSVTSLRLRTHR